MTTAYQERMIYRLSNAIIILAATASLGGLLLPDLYRDNTTYTTIWKANDAVTLFVVLPLLILSILKTKKGSAKSLLLWTGMLAYMLYNYAFYLFGAAFNWFFLLYAGIFCLSIYALFIRLATLNVIDIATRFSVRTPRKLLATFLVFVSAPLAIFEISQCIAFIVNGKMPGAPPLIFALDLSIVVPNTALAAWLLIRNRAWGYILTSIMLLKSFTYGTVLTVATYMVAGFHVSAITDPLAPFYVFVMTGGCIGSVVFFRHLNVQPKILCYISLYTSFHHYSTWAHPFNRLRKWYRHLLEEVAPRPHDHQLR